MPKKSYAIIVAGGRGSRMGSEVPKQFLQIDGKPILRLTIEKFVSLGRDVEIIVVLPSDQMAYWRKYCLESSFDVPQILVGGGISRFHSVQNALAYVEDDSVVAVHDGVRPLVSTAFLNRMYDAALSSNAVIPVMPSVESLRQWNDERTESHSVDRGLYMTVQTPQVFDSTLLKNAYKQAYSPLFTDDASVVEAVGCKLALEAGERYNIKITTPDDLQMARIISSGFCL